jgi:hypothetical protein
VLAGFAAREPKVLEVLASEVEDEYQFGSGIHKYYRIPADRHGCEARITERSNFDANAKSARRI